MNERIKQLAIENCSQMEWDGPHLPIESLTFTSQNLEKFAELIVKECADLCLKHETFEGLFQRTEYRQGRHFSTMIKAHFGVEE